MIGLLKTCKICQFVLVNMTARHNFSSALHEALFIDVHIWYWTDFLRRYDL